MSHRNENAIKKSNKGKDVSVSNDQTHLKVKLRKMLIAFVS